MNNNDKSHPVWDVYDEFRLVAFNELYYSKRAINLYLLNKFFETIIAITTSISAIVTIAFLESSLGGMVWKVLITCTAIISTLKPILNLTSRIRKYDEIVSKYRTIKTELKTLKVDISQHQEYTIKHQDRFKEILKKCQSLYKENPERIVSKKIKLACKNEIEKMYPVKFFYIPKK